MDKTVQGAQPQNAKLNTASKIVGIPAGLLIGLGLVGLLFSYLLTDEFPFLVAYRSYFIAGLIGGFAWAIVGGIILSVKGKADRAQAKEAADKQLAADLERLKDKVSALPHPPTFINIPDSFHVIWKDHGRIYFYYDYVSDDPQAVALCLNNDPWSVLYEEIAYYKSEGTLTTSQKIDPGKSDTAPGGMGGFLGGMVGGAAGNLIAMADNISFGKGPSIKTETTDTRTVVLLYRNNQGNLIKSTFPFSAEAIFDQLIPEKSLAYLQSKQLEALSLGTGAGVPQEEAVAAIAGAAAVLGEVLTDDAEAIEGKLTKLQNLLEKKLITQEEYDKKRAALIAKL